MEQEYERLAKASYARNKKVEGYEIISDLSTDDRVAYRNKNSGHVVIAFRGTDPTGFSNNRAFRDITTDILLGFELENWSSRFRKSEERSKIAVERYGKRNVTVVGHSLGGSQALDVSNKLGVEAFAFNPYVGSQHLRQQYPHATVVHNISDPISMRSPFISAKSIKIRYDRTKYPGLPQHSLNPPPAPFTPYVPPSQSGPRAIQ